MPSSTDAGLNAGTFVLGGGGDCTDLYTGELVQIAVVHKQYYNVALISIAVGDQAAIPVPPIAPGRPALSNAVIDSGTSTVLLDQSLYTLLVAAFCAQFGNDAAKLCIHQGRRLPGRPTRF